jgi:predicted RNA-binding Zn ribbon-like protein
MDGREDPALDEATHPSLDDHQPEWRSTAAPAPLRLVQAFLNTWNQGSVEARDRLGTAETARDWLSSYGLVDAHAAISEPARERLVAFREALRGVVCAGDRALVDPIDRRIVNDAAEGGVRVVLGSEGRFRTDPIGWGVEAAMARMLDVCYRAWLDGTWQRLKGCRRCRRIFYDRSKNRSRTWCSMSTCGNRTKNQAYRRRRANAG